MATKPTRRALHGREMLRWCRPVGVICVAALLLAIGPACDKAGDSGGASANKPMAIPQPEVEAAEAGGRVARIDVDALAAWCRKSELPAPPMVRQCEPGIAEALTRELAKVAKTRAAEDFGGVGQVCYVLQDHDSARSYFKAAAEANPRDSRWPYFLGVIAQDLADDKQAIEDLNRALSLKSDLAIAHARLGQIHVDAGELDVAWKHSELYARMVPRDSLGYVLLGRIELEREKFVEAVRFLEAATQRVPNDFQAHHYLGRAYAGQGLTEKARRTLDFAASLPKGNWFKSRDPLHFAALELSGSSAILVRDLEKLLNSQQWDKMAALMEQIIELRVGDFKMMANLADVYRKMGRFDDAHRMLDKAQRISPEVADLHAKRAALYLSQERFEEAITSADKALQSDDATFQPWAVKGRALFILERYAEAEPVLRKVIEQVGDDAETWYLLGIALHRTGRNAEAVDCFRRVQTIVDTPDHPLYRIAGDHLATLSAKSEK